MEDNFMIQGIYLTVENDAVLDFINGVPIAIRRNILQALNVPDIDVGIAFKSGENIYGMLYKFGNPDDTGLTLAISKDKEELARFILESFKNINEEASRNLSLQILKLDDEEEQFEEVQVLPD